MVTTMTSPLPPPPGFQAAEKALPCIHCISASSASNLYLQHELSQDTFTMLSAARKLTDSGLGLSLIFFSSVSSTKSVNHIPNHILCPPNTQDLQNMNL